MDESKERDKRTPTHTLTVPVWVDELGVVFINGVGISPSIICEADGKLTRKRKA